MKIRKAFQGTIPENKILDTYSESKTDAYSCNQSNKLSSYSYDEQVIGTWVDGKPLYRRLFDIGALPNATSKLFDTGIASGKIHLVSLKGLARRLTGIVAFIPLPHTGVSSSTLTSGIILTSWEESGTLRINVQAGSNRSDYNGIVTIEYTKTSD